MKKGRFLWSAHRITERQKAGKARSIKGKQLKNSRKSVSWLPIIGAGGAAVVVLLVVILLVHHRRKKKAVKSETPAVNETT